LLTLSAESPPLDSDGAKLFFISELSYYLIDYGCFNSKTEFMHEVFTMNSLATSSLVFSLTLLIYLPSSSLPSTYQSFLMLSFALSLGSSMTDYESLVFLAFD